jgi:hypothetical protein
VDPAATAQKRVVCVCDQSVCECAWALKGRRGRPPSLGRTFAVEMEHFGGVFMAPGRIERQACRQGAGRFAVSVPPLASAVAYGAVQAALQAVGAP